MCALAGTTGRIQISKIWRLRATFGIGKELEHPARKRLDVGVVAVVDAADLANALVEPPDDEAMLAEPGARDRQRGEIGVRAGDLDRKPERDGGGARVLLEDLHVDARGPRAPSTVTRGAGGPCGQRRAAASGARESARPARRR